MTEQPYDIAIVIPCFNEEKYIGQCLDSILGQTYPTEKIHVLVCDGKSTDGTIEIIENYTKKYSNIVYLVNEKQTTPFALNLGLKYTNAPIKVILGGHSFLTPNYVEKCLTIFKQNPEASCVGGIIDNIYENKTARIIGLAMSSPFGVGNAHFRTGEKSGWVDTVAFGAYTQDVFDTCGYFDEELKRNQDDEFNYRLTLNNKKIWLDQSLRSKYYVRGNYKKLLKQYFQYGYWKVFVNTKHKKITSIRQLVPFFFVNYLLLLFVSLFVYKPLFFVLLPLLGVYLIGATYYANKKVTNFSDLVQVAYVFLLLHVSYGAGYLKGFIHFILLQKKPNTVDPNISR